MMFSHLPLECKSQYYPKTKNNLSKNMDSSDDLFCVFNSQGILQFVNKRWQENLDWGEKDLESQHWIDFIHEDDRSATLEKLNLPENKQEVVLENRCRHRNGSYRWLCWKLFIQKNQLIYAFGKDVTEHKKAEICQRLVKKTLPNSGRVISKIWVSVIDTCGQVVYCNQDKPIGTQFIDSVHPCDRFITQEKLQNLKKSEEHNGFACSPMIFVNRYRTADGSYKLLSWKATFLPRKQLIYATAYEISDDQASVQKLIENWRDILETKTIDPLTNQNGEKLEKPVSDRPDELAKVQAELTKTKEQLQQEIAQRQQAQTDLNRIFNLSPDLLIVAGSDDYFKQVNPAVETILGYSPAEFLAKPWLDFVHPDDRDTTLAKMAASLETGSENSVTAKSPVSVFYFENRYRHKDGSYRWLAWKVVPVVDDLVWYSSARDITEQKDAESALRRSEAQSRQLANQEKLLNQLAKDIRHSLHLDTILNTAVEEIQSLLEVDRCTFIWYRGQDSAQNSPIWDVVKEAKHPNLPSLLGQAPIAPGDPLLQKNAQIADCAC
jgi:PAS domain S-box-containing protein